jgi:hypothetical protein
MFVISLFGNMIFSNVKTGHFYGSIFVSIYARKFLEGPSEARTHLTGTIELKFCLEALLDSNFIHDLDHIIRCFDKTTKPRFRDANEPQYVKFGSTRDNDAVHNIRFGQLKLFG